MNKTYFGTGLLIGALCVAAWQANAQDTGERQEPRDAGARDLGATSDGFVLRDGEALYAAACSGCHQPQGQGAYGAGQYPTLAANPRLAGGRYPAWIVLNGMGGMPAFNSWLDDEQIIAVVTYVQTSFGNRYADAPPTPELLRELRENLGDTAPDIP